MSHPTNLIIISNVTLSAPVVVRPKQPASGSVQVVQELFRIVVATRDSQEIERKRRLAWEQEQEAKYTQRQAEMERQMLELRQEISKLRSASTNPPPSSGLLTPQYSNSPALAVQRPQLASPVSPVSQPSSYTHPMFVQGSSTQPMHSHATHFDEPNYNTQQQTFEEPTPAIEPPPSSVTPAPSPHFSFVHSSQMHETSASPANRRKRASSQLSSDEEDNGDSSDSSVSTHGRPAKRRSGHDKRCLTVHVRLFPFYTRILIDFNSACLTRPYNTTYGSRT